MIPALLISSSTTGFIHNKWPSKIREMGKGCIRKTCTLVGVKLSSWFLQSGDSKGTTAVMTTTGSRFEKVRNVYMMHKLQVPQFVNGDYRKMFIHQTNILTFFT